VCLLIVCVIGGFRWMPVARLVRAQFFSLREKEFVEAARALGASTTRQVVRHILPNALGPVIVAGTIDSGCVHVGSDVIFYPSGKKGTVKSIEGFNRDAAVTAQAGEATGFTLTEQLYVSRGEMVAVAGETRPHVTTRIRASVFWLGTSPLVKHRSLVSTGTRWPR